MVSEYKICIMENQFNRNELHEGEANKYVGRVRSARAQQTLFHTNRLAVWYNIDAVLNRERFFFLFNCKHHQCVFIYFLNVFLLKNNNKCWTYCTYTSVLRNM